MSRRQFLDDAVSDPTLHIDPDSEHANANADTADASDPSTPAPPTDRCYFVFMYLVLLGALSIPFCALTASPHFLANYYKMFNIATSTLKYERFWVNAPSIVSCVYFCLNVPFQAVAVRTREFHPRWSLASSFFGIGLGLAIMPLAPVVAPHASEEATLVILIIIAVITSFSAAFAQSGTFGMLGKFPTDGIKYSVCGPIGIGFSGVIAAIMRVVFAAAIPEPTQEDTDLEARVFFAIVVLTNWFAAAFTHLILTRAPFAQYHLSRRIVRPTKSGGDIVTPLIGHVVVAAPESNSSPSLLAQVGDLVVINLLVMVGSYAIYPGVAARDVDNNRLWGPIVFVSFNGSSTIGRVICACYTPRNAQAVRRFLMIGSVIRIPIIFALSLVGVYSHGSLGNGFIAATIVQFFSGLTNGLGSATAYNVSNAVCPREEDRPAVSRYMTVGMATGLAIGGILGLIFCVTAQPVPVPFTPIPTPMPSF